MSEPTLGEIISALLSPPVVRLSPVDDLAVMQVIGRHLAGRIADLTGLGAEQVWDAMCHLPDNMLSLLESPQGWTVVASYIASGERVPDPFLKPTVH